MSASRTALETRCSATASARRARADGCCVLLVLIGLCGRRGDSSSGAPAARRHAAGRPSRPRRVAATAQLVPRPHAAEPVVPHVHRLPDPGRAAAAAGARRADRRRPARPGVAQGPVRLVHPELQHLQLHARDAGGVGRARTCILGDALSRATTLRWALAGLAACVVVRRASNHVLLAPMLRLARGHSLARVGALLVREPLDRPRARDARRRASPRSGTATRG